MTGAGGMAIGPDGFAYVADSGNSQIDVFSPSAAFSRSIGKASDDAKACSKDDSECVNITWGKAGILRSPKDVVVDDTGRVYVASAGNHRVDVFAADGTFVRAFGEKVNATANSTTPDVCTAATGCKRGSTSGAPEALSSPSGLGIDAGGNIYVADTGNWRVDVFTSEGKYTRSIGKEMSDSAPIGDECKKDLPLFCPKEAEGEAAGAMKSPADVAVDGKGQVAVADTGNHRIDIFAADGTFVHAFGKSVSGNILCGVSGGCDTCKAGSLLAGGCKKGTASGLAGGLSSPRAIAVSASGAIYVADTGNHRIDEFKFDGTFVRALGAGVTDGASAFQVCTPQTACRAGVAAATPGAVSSPSGTATDCGGAIYAVEVNSDDKNGPSSTRVERFGEQGVLSPPCLPFSEEETPSTSSSSEVPPLAVVIPPGGKRAVAKPKVKIELNPGTGTAVLIVIVPEPGSLALRGKGIRKVKRQAKQAGLIELLLETTGKLERKLKDEGKAKAKISLTYAPEGGGSNIQGVAVMLKMGPQL